MANLAPLIQTPRPYSMGDNFALWIHWFEAYTRAVKIPDDKLSDALLALLDNADSEHLICLDTGRNGEGLDYK